MKVTVTKKPGCEAEVQGILAASDIERHFEKAIDRAVRSIELPGFRKGKAPREHVLNEVGEHSVWRDAAEEALTDELISILKEHGLMPILTPTISLTVTGLRTDVPFTVTVIGAPTLTLNDYESLATRTLRKLEPLNRDKEREGARTSLLAQVNSMLGKTTPAEQTTDDDAKKLGFENSDALQHFINDETERAVDQYDDQRRRGAVADALIAEAKADIPVVMIDDEARAMLESMKHKIAEQMPFSEYLEKRGMSEDDVIDELRPQAMKRLTLDLAFAKIAKEKALEPDQEEVHEVAHALERQGVPTDRAHSYAAETSIREKIWQLLGVTVPKKVDTEKPA